MLELLKWFGLIAGVFGNKKVRVRERGRWRIYEWKRERDFNKVINYKKYVCYNVDIEAKGKLMSEREREIEANR